MRSLLFLLIFTNIAVFALSAGWFGGGAEVAAVPSVSHQPLSPDKIRIVSRGEPPPRPVPVILCNELRGLSASQATATEKSAAAQPGVTAFREETRAAVRQYGVFIPIPKGGKSAGEKKASELQALGITGFRVVEADPGGWMLLLGTYDSDARAREALTAFKKAGVRSARQGIHSEMPAQYRVRLSGTKEALAGFNKPAAAGEVVKCDPPLPEPPSVPVAGKNATTGLTE